MQTYEEALLFARNLRNDMDAWKPRSGSPWNKIKCSLLFFFYQVIIMDHNQVQKIMQSWQTPQQGRIRIAWNDVNDVIKWLGENTGSGMINDPFLDVNNTLFRECGLLLGSGLNYKELGACCFKKYYEKCVELEIQSNTRIHKGDMLNWIGRYYYELTRYDEAFYYWILDFLEDVLSEFYKTTIRGDVCVTDSLRAPVSEMLQLHFDVSSANLISLHDKIFTLLASDDENVLNPDVLKFKLRHLGHQIPRLIDYRSYHPNIPYLTAMYEKIKSTDDFNLWEHFAAFLLSSVDGMESITDLKVGGGTYQFDVIIRNCSSNELLKSILGDYIGIECKLYNDESINVEQIDHFAMKLKYHSMKSGIIFTKSPISGWKNNKGEQYGKLVQTKICNRDNIIVFDMNADDIDRIFEGINLIELIIEKYESVRLGL